MRCWITVEIVGVIFKDVASDLAIFRGRREHGRFRGVAERENVKLVEPVVNRVVFGLLSHKEILSVEFRFDGWRPFNRRDV